MIEGGVDPARQQAVSPDQRGCFSRGGRSRRANSSTVVATYTLM